MKKRWVGLLAALLAFAMFATGALAEYDDMTEFDDMEGFAEVEVEELEEFALPDEEQGETEEFALPVEGQEEVALQDEDEADKTSYVYSDIELGSENESIIASEPAAMGVAFTTANYTEYTNDMLRHV